MMPKVKVRTLVLLTGFLWLTASAILSLRAYSWFDLLTTNQKIIGISIGLLIALVKTRFIFLKLTLKNIDRILAALPNRISIWEFHLLKDKLLILLMIAMGIALRSAPFIPKYVLFPLYLGIGIAMFYVWVLYLKSFLDQKLFK
ncbi:MAG: hypothetical protein V1783_09160 [Bacteroidota bacterium]